MHEQPVDEVSGHLGRDVGAADHERYVTSPSGQVKRGLTGGVRSADNRDRATDAPAGFQFGGRIVDPGSLEVGPALQRQRAVASASRDDDGLAVKEVTFGQVQPYPAAVPVGVEFDRLARAGQLGAELQRLQDGAAG
nr:hypothetical protein [Trebonia kvetii]